MWGWDKRVEDFPADENEVPEGVHSFDFLQLALVILLGVEFAGDDELAAPGNLFLVLHLLHDTTVHLFALLFVHVGNDIDALKVFFRKFCAHWEDVRELNAELFVTARILFARLRKDRDPDDELRLTSFEDGHILDVGVLGSCLGGVGVRLVKLDRAVFDSYFSVGAIFTEKCDLSVCVRRECLDGVLCLGKANVARLVVVDDGDSALGVAAVEFVTATDGVEVDEEVAVRIPLLVVMDYNSYLLAVLASGELNDLVDCIEVALRGGS